MKILLDECLPVDFRHSFPKHDAHSAEWAGLKGKKNGELLLAAEVSLAAMRCFSQSTMESLASKRWRAEALRSY